MADDFGVSFVPDGNGDQNGQAGRQASPIQRAIQLLSLRLPRVSGAQQGALAPGDLLHSRGGGGMLTGADQRVSLDSPGSLGTLAAGSGPSMSPDMIQALIQMASMFGMPGSVSGMKGQSYTPYTGGSGQSYDPAKPLDSLLGGGGASGGGGGTKLPRFIPGDDGERRKYEPPQPDVIDRTSPGVGNRVTDPHAPRFRGGPFQRTPL